MLGNGTLIGVERIFDMYLGGCAIQTFVINVLSHNRDQCNIEAKCEALQSSFSYLKAIKINVKASEKEKLLFASIWPRIVLIDNYFKHRVALSYGRGT